VKAKAAAAKSVVVEFATLHHQFSMSGKFAYQSWLSWGWSQKNDKKYNPKRGGKKNKPCAPQFFPSNLSQFACQSRLYI